MDKAYETLGVSPGADPATIRRRYLELVRQYSPERAPERFAEIRAAYEQVRDPVRRMKALLFDWKDQDSINTILNDARNRLRARRIPTETLLKLGEDS